MLFTLLMLLLAGIVGLVALGIVLAMVGAVFGVVFGTLGLLVKALPFLLLGYVAFRLLRCGSRHRRGQISAADRRWLDG